MGRFVNDIECPKKKTNRKFTGISNVRHNNNKNNTVRLCWLSGECASVRTTTENVLCHLKHFFMVTPRRAVVSAK